MRLHHPFDDVFRNRSAVRVLRTLVRFPAKEFTGRELALESGAPVPNAIRELNRLRDQGIVERRTVGRAQLWRLRGEHELVAPLQAFFAAERGPAAHLRDACARCIARVPGARRAVLFGSVARGDERPDSDVDLLVIVRDARAKAAAQDALERLRSDVVRAFGNRLSPVVQTERDFASSRSAGLRRNVEREGIVLWEAPA